MDKTITVSSKVSARVAQLGKDHIIAYTFAKLLASTVKHPIIFNHRANLTPLRLLIELSDKTYRIQLNLALQLGYCRQEGKHLRLVSHKQERKISNVKSTASYEQINTKDLKQFIYISALKSNTKKQKQAIRYKQRPIANIVSTTVAVNYNITLSCRSAADLLGFKSYSHANNLLRNLQVYGLTMKKNIVEISETEYNYFKSIKKHNARYDHLTEKYLFINASQPQFTSFYKTKKQSNPVKWVNSDLFNTYF